MSETSTASANLFTLGELAAALGWSARFIEGLVRGEKFPAIETDGKLLFDRTAVTDWLQQKIQTLDERHIRALEDHIETDLIEKGVFRTHRSDRLASRLPLRGVALDLAIDSPQDILRALSEIAAGTGNVSDKSLLLYSLVEREPLCSTALPGGFAICHPRRPLRSAIERQFLCCIRTSQPIAFGSEDGELTRLFFLLCAPDDRSHLHGIARLARILHAEESKLLFTASDAETFKETLAFIEAKAAAPVFGDRTQDSDSLSGS